MASAHRDSPLALLQSIEEDHPDRQINKFLSANMTFAQQPKVQDKHQHYHPLDREMSGYEHESSQHQHQHQHGLVHNHVGVDPLQDTCGDSFEDVNAIITMDSTTKMAGQTVAPFLAKHIPDQYAPLGAPQSAMTSKKDPNTKFCYRHRPDSKCRRTADEPTMEILQRNLEKLSQADQQGISHVWSLFSAAPARHRNLMLQGILSQCCFPQLSYLSTAVRDLIRIDFLSALPSEISFKILCYLDTTSLCKAAQVSQRWRLLADDDVVWHKMCEQHIDRKCIKCSWGLPLLERKRLRDWKRQQQLRGTGRGLNEWSPQLTPAPEDNVEFMKTLVLKGALKRSASTSADQLQAATSDGTKRKCIEIEAPGAPAPPKFRPWKDVYKDRFKVGTNWKYGRCSTKVFRGHTNGVMCLQFDDNILATGSYDSTIKIWNMDTGECIRTLRGHTLGVRTLQFDDSKLISGSLDRTVKIWNWRTGELIASLDGHTEGVISVNFEGVYIVSGSIDKSIRVLNYKDKSTRTLTGHKDWVNAVKVDSASRTLFSASDDCTIRLWDLETMKTIRIFEGHVGQVQQVILLPAEFEPDDVDAEEADDSSSNISDDLSSTPQPAEHSTFEHWPSSRPRPTKYIMTAGLDSTVRLWDVNSGRCLKTFFGHVEGVWALAADSLRVVSGAEDRMVKVWDARSGKCQRTFTGHAGPVTCVGLSDSRMVTGSEDHEIRLYSFKSEDEDGHQVHTLGTAGESVVSTSSSS